MNYKTYAEAKIANPDCEIVTTGKDWSGDAGLIGIFEALVLDEYSDNHEDGAHEIDDESWVICNPADHCSTLKEFLDAGLKLVEGDVYVETSGRGKVVDSKNSPIVNSAWSNDCDRYILSASALNGGCKIQKAKQWTIYNNTLPLSELSDEQAAQLFNAWRAGGEVECAKNIYNNLETGLTIFDWTIADIVNWPSYQTYRIKQKSERELFIDLSIKLVTPETYDSMEKMFGAQFDAGARYTDPTQHFGESI